MVRFLKKINDGKLTGNAIVYATIVIVNTRVISITKIGGILKSNRKCFLTRRGLNLADPKCHQIGYNLANPQINLPIDHQPNPPLQQDTKDALKWT